MVKPVGLGIAGNHIVQSLAMEIKSIKFEQFSVCVTLKPGCINTGNYEKQH